MANESQTFGIDMGMHSGSMHDQPFHADVIDNQAQGDVDIDVDFANASMQAADRETGASIEVIPGGGAELFDQPIGDGVVDTSSAGHEAQEHAAGFAVEAAMRRARTSGLAQEAATLAAKKVDIGLPLESGPDPPAPTIKAGQILPSIRVAVKGPMLDIREYFAEKRGVIVGLPGAFTPSRMQNHIKGYHEICHQIKAHVGFLGCLVVNDPFVLKAWAKALGVETEMTFICDADCHLTKKLGLQTDISNLGMGIRCKRFAMIIGTGAEVKWIGFSEEEIQAPFVLQKLEEVFTESGESSSAVTVELTETRKETEVDDDERAAGVLNEAIVEEITREENTVHKDDPPADENTPHATCLKEDRGSGSGATVDSGLPVENEEADPVRGAEQPEHSIIDENDKKVNDSLATSSKEGDEGSADGQLDETEVDEGGQAPATVSEEQVAASGKERPSADELHHYAAEEVVMMNDDTHTVADAALIVQGIDLHDEIGVSGVPAVERGESRSENDAAAGVAAIKVTAETRGSVSPDDDRVIEGESAAVTDAAEEVTPDGAPAEIDGEGDPAEKLDDRVDKIASVKRDHSEGMQGGKGTGVNGEGNDGGLPGDAGVHEDEEDQGRPGPEDEGYQQNDGEQNTLAVGDGGAASPMFGTGGGETDEDPSPTFGSENHEEMPLEALGLPDDDHAPPAPHYEPFSNIDEATGSPVETAGEDRQASKEAQNDLLAIGADQLLGL